MQVPRTLLPEVSPDNLPNNKANFTPVENTGAKTLMDTGRGLSAVGREFGEIGLKMQEDINLSLSADATNQLFQSKDFLTNDKDEGFRALLGRNALDRPDGVSLVDEYVGRFDQEVVRIRGTLKNAAQQGMFIRNADTMRNQLLSGAREHTLHQNTLYQNSVDDGGIQTGLKMIAQGRTMEEWQAGINYAINSAGRKHGRLGVAGEEAEALLRKELSPGCMRRLRRKWTTATGRAHRRFTISQGSI